MSQARAAAAASTQASTDPDAEALHKPIDLQMVYRLLQQLRPYRGSYIGLCLAGLGLVCLEMVPPRLIGNAIDVMALGSFSMRPLLVTAALWSLTAILCQMLHGLQITIANRNGERVLTQLRQQMFDHLQRLSMKYYDRTHPGRIIARATSDIDAVRGILAWGLNTLTANALAMLVAAVMIWRTDAKLFLAVAWLAPVIMWLSVFFGRRIGVAWQRVRSHFTALSTNQAENIAGVRVVVAFNRQADNLASFAQMQELNTSRNVEASRVAGVFPPLLQWARYGGQLTILLYGGYLVAKKQLLPGDVVAAALYWDAFMQPAINFGLFFNELMMAMAGAERIFALLDEQPDIVDAPGAKALPSVTGRVTFDDIGFAYKAGRPVLKHIQFDIAPGSTVALVGTTGSGKTTIVSLLARFYQPTSGRILIDGYDIAQITAASLHAQMALVLQSNHLFSGTVLDNLRYARPEATDAEVIEAARRLNCHERFCNLKEAYQTNVGERGSALSLGERQLVCFTRAMVASPRILLLDEATSAVDSHTEAQLQRALKELVHGRTTFIVAHRLSTIVSADLILVMENGHIIERGTHHQLMKAGGSYAKLHAKAQELTHMTSPEAVFL